MRRTVKTVNGERYLLEVFDSFNEVISVCNNRTVKDDVTQPTRTMTDSEFMGASSYEEAVEMLKYGVDEYVNEFKTTVKDLEKKSSSMKISFKNDIVGYAPIVPNAIIGIPQNMINNVKVPKKSKVITLVVDMAVSSNVNKKDVAKFGMKLVQKIVQLEKSGYRVRLEYMKCFNNSMSHSAIATVIKNEHQPLDIKRVMFPLTNVAMQRYISWDWYDRVPDAKWSSDRGRSLSTFGGERRQEIIKELVSDSNNKYVICYGDDIDKILGGK